MNFVYEPMSMEDWKELVRMHPNGPYPGGKPQHWVADHENDVQLVGLGGQNGKPGNCDLRPNYYVLIWHKQVVRFESRYTTEIAIPSDVDNNNPQVINETKHHEVSSVYAPKLLKPQTDIIVSAIKQALLTEWQGRYSHTQFVVTAVHVNLPTINFV